MAFTNGTTGNIFMLVFHNSFTSNYFVIKGITLPNNNIPDLWLIKMYLVHEVSFHKYEMFFVTRYCLQKKLPNPKFAFRGF